MLKLKNIVKEYPTGDSKVVALKGVNIEFRKSEFVSILGHSGCGKTTLLNIIGGLDQYTDGDLIIEGKSTKDFKDGDWDSYRNHSIGFVFQNYNLIPHQSVLSNVELALTLSGVSKNERQQRAKAALEKVGLGDQLNKKPNQMSGGQMQRVAIARALVNNPEILLADEPTGALDTETSVQIMELLKEISEEKLVIMVTHNPELAEDYSTRIIRLVDGNIVDDTDPYTTEDVARKEKTRAEKKSEKKASKGMPKKPSMSFLTALSLSLNNLMTKKARTFLTSFAGSIGIIGIALILALSSGFQAYIDSIQQETLTSYPIMIEKTAMDMNSMMTGMAATKPGAVDHALDKVYSNTLTSSMMESFTSEIWSNNLEGFKAYIESDESTIKDYVSSVQYSYGGKMNIFDSGFENGINQVYPSPMLAMMETMMGSINIGGMQMDNSMMASAQKMMNSWQELIDNEEMLHDQFEVVKGSWPEKYNEVVLIVDKNNEVSDIAIQGLGLTTSEDMMQAFMAATQGTAEEYTPPKFELEYDEVIGKTFRIVLEPDYFEYNEETKTWDDMRGDEEYVRNLINNGEEIRIVGIVRPANDSIMVTTMGAIGYTSELTEHIINATNECEIVKQQKANPEVDVFTGVYFDEEKRAEQAEKTSAPELSGVSLDPQIDSKTQAIADTAPLASSMGLSSSAPKAVFTDTVAGMPDFSGMPAVSEEEVYAAIDEQFTGDEATKMKRTVELMLKPVLSLSERKELVGYLDEMLAGQEIEGMGEISGEQALSFLQMMDKTTKLKMLNAIMTGEFAPTTPPVTDGGEATTQPDVPEATTPGQQGETATKPQKPDTTKPQTPSQSQTPQQPQTPAEPQEPVVEPEPEPEPLPEPLAASYEEALSVLGVADLDNPQSIYIYPLDFESKDIISAEIEKYNESVTADGKEENSIKYTDYMGLLLSSVTSIINIVSYILIAFVAISLVVSSIMIGIITYISVLERTKEIGILRAIGASKKDISRVFNAETFIVGFVSGALGIGTTLLLTIPINAIIEHLTGLPNISKLPFDGAMILIAISVVLTLIAGLVPSKIASRKDPVEALRSE